MPGKDAPIISVMQRISATKTRYGYRRVLPLLAAEGMQMCGEKALRLWRKAGLLVPRKRTRKRPARSIDKLPVPTGCNQVWAYDFVHDACANGQKLKCLTVIDEFSREVLAIDVAGTIRSERVIQVLSRLVSERGLPCSLRSDNGPEFVAKQLGAWAKQQGLAISLIEPGKPWQNGFNESFNGKFRDECLSVEWFRNRREACVIIEQWRREYNTERPHSSLGYVPPVVFAQQAREKTAGCHSPCNAGSSQCVPLARPTPALHPNPATILN